MSYGQKKYFDTIIYFVINTLLADGWTQFDMKVLGCLQARWWPSWDWYSKGAGVHLTLLSDLISRLEQTQWQDEKTVGGFHHDQSGTKPNLVAKILATKIGNLWA